MSMKKKRKDQIGETGRLVTASGKATKARAGPPCTTFSMGSPELWDMNPRIENTTKPRKNNLSLRPHNHT